VSEPLGEDDLDPAGSLQRPQPPRTWRDRLDALADATGTAPARLAAGAVTVLASAVGVMWVLRPPPAPAELSLPFASTTTVAPESGTPVGSAPVTPPDGGDPPDPAGPGGDEVTSEVVVHMAGAVHDPGVHRLDAAARVVDGVRAAGGLTADADQARVNLAAPLTDGERVYVPRVDEADPPEPVAGVTPPSATGGTTDGTVVAPVDLNTADGPELETLPGVGPATSAAILEHRGRIGSFESVDQLIDVSGIGPATLEKLRPLVRV
jgi:competence protein ComEA